MTEQFLSTQVADLERKYVALAQAAKMIYEAGFWKLSSQELPDTTQARLWEKLRDAIEAAQSGPLWKPAVVVTNTPRRALPPDGGLGKPKRRFDETFSAFKVLADHFGIPPNTKDGA